MNTWGLGVMGLVGAVLLLLSVIGCRRWLPGRSGAVLATTLGLTVVVLAGWLGSRMLVRGEGKDNGKLAVTPRMMSMMMLSDEMRSKMAMKAAAMPAGAPHPGMMFPPASQSPLGKPAPQFTLPDVRTGEPVRLADVMSKRPLVILFGSWNCTVFCGQTPGISELEREYRGKVDFLLVQILDAPHPTPDALREAYALAGLEQETPENRLDRAALAADVMQVPFRHLLDTEDGDVCMMYKAFPQRLYIISEGRVVHDAGPGGIFGGPKYWPLQPIRAVLDGLLAKK